MYAKHEASKIRQDFWTSFGQYMSPVSSSEGERINWLNYRTGEKDIVFRMQADDRFAEVAIQVVHKDPDIRELFYQQFLQLKKIFEESMQEEWNWLPETTDENGKRISKIYIDLRPVNIYSRQHWPALISFFKPRIVALDAFWNDVKYAFEALH